MGCSIAQWKRRGVALIFRPPRPCLVPPYYHGPSSTPTPRGRAGSARFHHPLVTIWTSRTSLDSLIQGMQAARYIVPSWLSCSIVAGVNKLSKQQTANSEPQQTEPVSSNVVVVITHSLTVAVELTQEAESTPQTDGTGPTPSFDWKSNWYPVFPIIDADKAIPHAFQVKIMRHSLLDL